MSKQNIKPDGSLPKVVFVSTPWPLFNRPSIQIGTLKSYLQSKHPGLTIQAHHFFLQVAGYIGFPSYHAISQRIWLAESVYGALLYPDRFDHISNLFYRKTLNNPAFKYVDFKDLVTKIKTVSDEFINSVKWETFKMAGFSISFCQLTSSLYFIRKIKKRHPKLLIVIGGSMFAGNMTKNVFDVFPEIDIIVNGEGEIPLSRLIKHLKNGFDIKDLPPISGIVTPESIQKKQTPEFNQIKDLSDLPIPDYDDYFNLLKSLEPENTFFPTIPVEISRGCWWRGSHGNKKYSGCAFCNLNLQWDGYRSKKASGSVMEIDRLTTRYKTLSVAFMDNMLPLKTSKQIFSSLPVLKKDFKMFGEIRPNTPVNLLAIMKTAGMEEVQIGIESLSTGLLKKLNKGVTAIENIEIMKICETLGILNSSNLIFYFPGSDKKDVLETLFSLEFVLPFRPLKIVHFWLGLGSPVWQYPKEFKLKAVFNHRYYSTLFPKEIVNNIPLTIQEYRGDLGYQKRIWEPVKEKVRKWKQAYFKLKGPDAEPILSFRDGRDFLIIHQKIPDKETITHMLEKTSKKIYLYCQKTRSIDMIVERFSMFQVDKIESFLKMMVGKKLMFRENDKFLSLAIPAKK